MKQRLHYFDILKGIAIFMVVMGHVLTMCVREIDRAALFKFIGEIHMPLFFFISGWFTFKLTENGRVRVPDLGQRALQLLVPMVVVSTLWIWYFPHSGLQSPLDSTFGGLWSDSWKNGYWFTFVLFQIMLLYALLCPLLTRLKSAASSLGLTVIVWALLIYINHAIGLKASGFASLLLTSQFFPVFMVGTIASRHRECFNRICKSGFWVTASLILAALLLYYICWPWEFPEPTNSALKTIPVWVARSLFHICLAVVAIAVIKPWSERIYSVPSPSGTAFRWAETWQLLGRKSLSIYLLHYFFLFPMGICRDTLMAFNLGFTPLFVFSAAVAACVIAIVLGVNAVIERSPLLALLLTGVVPKKKKSLAAA